MTGMVAQVSAGMRVAIIGAGIMGRAIEAAIVSKRVSVELHSFRALSISATSISNASIIIDATRNTETSAKALATILNHAQTGTLIFNVATLTPRHLDWWASEVSRHGCIPVECPVTGSHWRGSVGELTGFMYAPSDEHANAELLAKSLFCKRVFHFNRVGDPTRFKLAFNEANGVLLLAVANFLERASSVGKAKQWMEILGDESSWLTDVARFASRSSNPASPVTITVENFLKDLSYCRDAYGPTTLSRVLIDSFACLPDRSKDFTSLFNSAMPLNESTPSDTDPTRSGH